MKTPLRQRKFQLERNSPALPSEQSVFRTPRAQVHCVLSEVMGRHRISQSALSKASSIRPATIHMLYHAKTESVSLAVLASILDGLRKLTGVAYEVSDILSIAFLPDSGALMDAQKYAPQGKA